MRVLITGGAGFVGSYLAHQYRQSGAEVHCLDNLRRRGSETNIAPLQKAGIQFHHGDIRNPSDFDELVGHFDILIECSAEPSVFAGATGSPKYVIDTNLMGTVNCLEFARRQCHGVVFLSTSRVYSISALCSLPLTTQTSRLELPTDAIGHGFSHRGISEFFSTASSRTFYGASKLASEILCQEYALFYNTNIVINRCGVIAGPGQFGKTDQGVFSLWIAHHLMKRPLKYTGFGGQGLQVRDLLHPQDLFELLKRQVKNIESCRGEIFNVGGGPANSVSLQEYTAICQQATSSSTDILSKPETAKVDIPYFVSDNTKVGRRFDWRPVKSVGSIVSEIANWMRSDPARLEYLYLSA